MPQSQQLLLMKLERIEIEAKLEKKRAVGLPGHF